MSKETTEPFKETPAPAEPRKPSVYEILVIRAIHMRAAQKAFKIKKNTHNLSQKHITERQFDEILNFITEVAKRKSIENGN